MDEKLQHIFERNHGVLRTTDLNSAGCYYSNIQEMLNNNEIEQIRRGYYRIVDSYIYSDVPVLKALFPDTVICLESALFQYDYIDRTPSAWHLAVKDTSARARFKIDYMKVKPHFVTLSRFNIGIAIMQIDGFDIQIYDKDRTMCDVLSHKNKLDAETFSQACQSYVKDKRHNIPTLVKYSKILHVENKVREVLGPWL